MKLPQYNVVCSDLASWPRPSPWPMAAGIGSGIFDRPDRSSVPTDYIVGVISARVDGADDDMAGAGNRPQAMVRSAPDPLAALVNAALIWLRDTPPCGHDRILRRGEMIEAIVAERNVLPDVRKAAAAYGLRLPQRALCGAVLGQLNS